MLSKRRELFVRDACGSPGERVGVVEDLFFEWAEGIARVMRGERAKLAFGDAFCSANDRVGIQSEDTADQ